MRTAVIKVDYSPVFTHYGDKSLVVNETGIFFAHKIVKIRDQIDAKAISTTESIPDDPSVDEAHLPSSSRCPRVMC